MKEKEALKEIYNSNIHPINWARLFELAGISKSLFPSFSSYCKGRVPTLPDKTFEKIKAKLLEYNIKLD